MKKSGGRLTVLKYEYLGNRFPVSCFPNGAGAECTNRWKYIQTFGLRNPSKLAFEELYDLPQDSVETTSLAGSPDHPGIQEDLQAELTKPRREVRNAEFE